MKPKNEMRAMAQDRLAALNDTVIHRIKKDGLTEQYAAMANIMGNITLKVKYGTDDEIRLATTMITEMETALGS